MVQKWAQVRNIHDAAVAETSHNDIVRREDIRVNHVAHDLQLVQLVDNAFISMNGNYLFRFESISVDDEEIATPVTDHQPFSAIRNSPTFF